MTGGLLAVTFALLGAALLLAVWRLMIGPSLPDRIVALELIASITVGIIAAYAVHTRVSPLLDVAVVLALTGFLAGTAFALYVQRAGEPHD